MCIRDRAIGGPKKKRKLDEALESLQNDKTPVNNSATPTSTANTTPTTQVCILCLLQLEVYRKNVLFLFRI